MLNLLSLNREATAAGVDFDEFDSAGVHVERRRQGKCVPAIQGMSRLQLNPQQTRNEYEMLR